MIEIRFTHLPLEIPAEIYPSREIGASLDFKGIVRELENGEALKGLFYEAYEPMALSLLQKHLAELLQLHHCSAVHFIHRLGWVPVGEASLYLRVLSSHRGQALGFLADAVDRLKKDVPIWKLHEPPP